jgi:hypothetical protein
MLLTGWLAMLPLAAQVPITYNLHLGALSAQGDFRTEVGSLTGLDTGLSMTIPLTQRLDLRPRVSYQLFPVLENNFAYKSSRYSDRGFENAKWSAWSFGADCLFHPGGAGSKLYLLTGLSYKAWKVESYGTFTTQDPLLGTRTFSVDDKSTSNEPALDMGLGLALSRHFSVETRITLASYRKLSYNTLQLGMVARY